MSDTGLKQVSLARLKEFGVTPKRDLGQNFLIDDNILGVILARLECGPDDVALEVGAGLGVLTAALAAVAAHVHAFEIDRSLDKPLRATLAGRSNMSLHFDDILKAELAALEPPPTLCASNLPYSVAGPFVIESLQKLPSVRRYCVMVQREVAERMAAAPGSKAYGILSVWVQLYCETLHVRSTVALHLLPAAARGLELGGPRPPAGRGSARMLSRSGCEPSSRPLSASAARPSSMPSRRAWPYRGMRRQPWSPDSGFPPMYVQSVSSRGSSSSW